MRAKIENMILSDYVLYYIPQYLEILWKLLNILEFIRKEVAASLISVAAPLRFWIFFGNFERFEILENYEL